MTTAGTQSLTVSDTTAALDGVRHDGGARHATLTAALGITLSDVPSPGPAIEPGPLLDFVSGHLERPLARPADITVGRMVPPWVGGNSFSDFRSQTDIHYGR
jgi:hypothetical protein